MKIIQGQLNKDLKQIRICLLEANIKTVSSKNIIACKSNQFEKENTNKIRKNMTRLWNYLGINLIYKLKCLNRSNKKRILWKYWKEILYKIRLKKKKRNF